MGGNTGFLIAVHVRTCTSITGVQECVRVHMCMCIWRNNVCVHAQVHLHACVLGEVTGVYL